MKNALLPENIREHERTEWQEAFGLQTHSFLLHPQLECFSAPCCSKDYHETEFSQGNEKTREDDHFQAWHQSHFPTTLPDFSVCETKRQTLLDGLGIHRQKIDRDFLLVSVRTVSTGICIWMFGSQLVECSGKTRKCGLFREGVSSGVALKGSKANTCQAQSGPLCL